MQHKRPAPKQQQKAVDEWNSHWPIGTNVIVKMDDGQIRNTQTRSEAWLMGGHTAVISVDGIAGGYMLSRVRAAA